MSTIRALVALDDGISPSDVASALPDDDGLEVVEWLDTAASLENVRNDPVDLLIVACSATPASALPLIKTAASQQPDRPLVVLQMSPSESNGFMQDVFTAGADDIITLPETHERVRHALQKAIARKRGVTLARGSVPALLVCVLGPKGGTGKTVTSTNLAVALAEGGRRTTLVDLDLHFGDVGLGLRLTPERTLYDLARSGGTLDAEKLEDYLASHPSGLHALLAPTRPDHAGAITPGFISETLSLLRSMSDVVVVDTSAGFPPEVITTIDGSTDVCVVGMLDAFSLKDTKLGLETLDRMGYDRGSIRLVLNRADTHVGISQDDVASILGRTPDILVPSQRDIPRTVTDGNPIVLAQPRSNAARAFRKLASMYTTELVGAPNGNGAPAQNGQRRRSLLRRA